MNRAVFLDRDGVINRKAPEGSYIIRWEDFCFLEDTVEAIRQLNRAGFRVVVVTNQRCVAKGLISPTELEMLHRRMSDHLATTGARIDSVYYCPHDNEPLCRCRKPAPGMLLDAAQSQDIDLKQSWMVGDSEIDVAAGKNAGCKTARLLPRHELTSDRSEADVVAPSLLNAILQILQVEQRIARSLTAAY